MDVVKLDGPRANFGSPRPAEARPSVIHSLIMLRLMMLLSVTCSGAFCALRVSSLRAAQQQRALSRRRYAKAQLDHEGREDFDFSPSKGFSKNVYQDDEEILAAIEAKLEKANKVPIATFLKLGNVHTLLDDEAMDESSCYLLPEVSTNGSLTHYYICSQPPEDNENLVCEQQADGLDWVCKSTWSP